MDPNEIEHMTRIMDKMWANTPEGQEFQWARVMALVIMKLEDIEEELMNITRRGSP